MRVGEICNRQVVIGRPEMTVVEAAQLMREHQVGDIVIVEARDDGNEPVAVVTDRDLVIEVLARGASSVESSKVLDAMTCELVTVKEDESVSDLIRRMGDAGVRRMPVVNDRGTLEGITTYDDLVDYLAEQLGALHAISDRQQRFEAMRMREEE